MEDLNRDPNLEEQLALLEEIAANTRITMRETTRIRKNIVFFFWVTIITMFGWIFGLLLFGSLAAIFGTTLGGM